MALVRMKEKGQVTIPVRVRESIDANIGDVFEVSVLEGKILLSPKDVLAKASPRRLPKTNASKGDSAKARSVDISAWLGAGKGTFKTPEEVDAFIRAERSQWE